MNPSPYERSAPRPAFLQSKVHVFHCMTAYNCRFGGTSDIGAIPTSCCVAKASCWLSNWVPWIGEFGLYHVGDQWHVIKDMKVLWVRRFQLVAICEGYTVHGIPTEQKNVYNVAIPRTPTGVPVWAGEWTPCSSVFSINWAVYTAQALRRWPVVRTQESGCLLPNSGSWCVSCYAGPVLCCLQGCLRCSKFSLHQDVTVHTER